MLFRFLTLLCLALCSFSASAQQYLEMIEAGTYTITEIQQAAKTHFDIVGRERGSGYKQFKRWEYVAMMELDAAGVKIPNAELTKRASDYRRAEKQQQTESSSFAGNWKELGPSAKNATSSWSPGVGRITSIGIDESNPSHLIVGSPTGGVWKTLNGGDNWVPLSDDFSTVDVYSLEISPYNNNHYLWGSTSGKIFRSIDGGISWAATSNVAGSGKVVRILYHPTNPAVVYAVSESNGLFRSVDSGGAWTAVAGASGVAGYDVEFKPGDPNTIYFSGISVYRSINGGTVFSQIGGFGTANNNYKMMGVSPADPNFLYVLESNGGKFGAFYKSTNSGASFSKLVDGADINYFGYSEIGDDDGGQAPRDMDVAVSPFEANEVHISGVHTWKSFDGGENFFLTSYWVPGTAASLGVGYNHADVGILKFAGSTLFVGSDGGIYTSTDGAESFVDRTPGLGIREFYKIGVSKTDPNVVSGGSQDNGTGVMRGTNRVWVDWLGADGMETFVDWSNANNIFGTSQYGSMYRSTNQGTSRSGISKPIDDVDGAWVTPFEQDPLVSTTIYVAFADVWKSTNSGTDWTKISEFDNGNMNQMKLAPSDNQRIYVSRGSSLFTTANGGGVWTSIATGWGTSSISYIAVHPQNPQRLLIVTSSGVYHSMNAGLNWTNIATGLPSGVKYCAAWENTGKNGIYVGGFGFVSYTNDDLAGQWTGFLDGLPNVRVYELELNYLSNTIFAGTYGRGVWESQLYEPLAPVAAFTADKHEGCGELTVTFTDKSAYSPTAWAWTFEGGTPATSTLQHPTVTFNGSGTFVVRLKSSNSVGESILEAVDSIFLTGPLVPMVADMIRCNPGEVSLEAIGKPGEQINWYAAASGPSLLFSGETFTTNISQTTTFYATASTEYVTTDHVGPVSKDIGSGNDHAGGRLIYLDVQKSFRLKSAIVYATGAGNRTFRLMNANGIVLLEKTVAVSNGESRIMLDMDIPQGDDLQLTCISPASLFRNSSGVNYPYSIPGIMQITGSSGGSEYYYYLYDIEVESTSGCESVRVPVSGIVQTALVAPTLAPAAPTTLCLGESLVLTAENVCPDCIVHWSNGETGPSITVGTAGSFTATVSSASSDACGDSPSSNMVNVSTQTVPAATTIAASGATTLCLGESLVLTAENVCPDCIVHWSTGETGPSITVSTSGSYSAYQRNSCGDGLGSNNIDVSTASVPGAPTVVASGATVLCAGESVTLTAENVCPDCIVHWSNGETGLSITVGTAGSFTATVSSASSNACGDSPGSNMVTVSIQTVPAATTIAASGAPALCLGESLVLTAENVCPDCIVHWSNGETGPSITVSTSGSYTAYLSNSCGDGLGSNNIDVSTGSVPGTPTVVASGATVLCAGESVTLTAENVCPDCIVHWSNGEVGLSITVSTSGSYTAYLSNSCGDGLGSNNIDVSTGSVPGIPTVVASGATVLCAGESVTLTAENVCPDCIVHWSNGETGLSITVGTAGSFTATVSSAISNACGESPVSNAIEVTINPPFIPLVQVSNLCHLSAPTGSDYQWSINGVAIPNANGPSWTALVAGQYVVSMLDQAECFGTSAPVFAEACVSSTQSVEGQVSARVYPNPAQDRVFLEVKLLQASSAHLDLYAVDGRFVGRLFQGDILSGGQVLDIALSELPPGMYQFRLVTAFGGVQGNLVVLRH